MKPMFEGKDAYLLHGKDRYDGVILAIDRTADGTGFLIGAELIPRHMSMREARLEKTRMLNIAKDTRDGDFVWTVRTDGAAIDKDGEEFLVGELNRARL